MSKETGLQIVKQQRVIFDLADAEKFERGLCGYCECMTSLESSRFAFFCEIHNGIGTGLEIKKSTIPNAGDGLFVWSGGNGFLAEDVLDVYGGKITKDYPRQTHDNDNRYVFEYKLNDRQYFIDGISTKSCMARWSNSNSNTNAIYRPFGGMILLFALRDLRPGEEIFVDYGPLHTIF